MNVSLTNYCDPALTTFIKLIRSVDVIISLLNILLHLRNCLFLLQVRKKLFFWNYLLMMSLSVGNIIHTLLSLPLTYASLSLSELSDTYRQYHQIYPHITEFLRLFNQWTYVLLVRYYFCYEPPNTKLMFDRDELSRIVRINCFVNLSVIFLASVCFTYSGKDDIIIYTVKLTISQWKNPCHFPLNNLAPKPKNRYSYPVLFHTFGFHFLYSILPLFLKLIASVKFLGKFYNYRRKKKRANPKENVPIDKQIVPVIFIAISSLFYTFIWLVVAITTFTVQFDREKLICFIISELMEQLSIQAFGVGLWLLCLFHIMAKNGDFRNGRSIYITVPDYVK